MTLFKLIHIHEDEEESECGSDYDGSIHKDPSISRKAKNKLRRMFSPRPKGSYPGVAGRSTTTSANGSVNGSITGHTSGDKDAPIKKMRTLQRFHSGRNEEGMMYMERNSVLTPRRLAVSAEQVSIFLTAGAYFVIFLYI
jgi:hypothetical protein